MRSSASPDSFGGASLVQSCAAKKRFLRTGKPNKLKLLSTGMTLGFRV